MKNLTFTFITLLFFITAKADCTFESFAVGEEFSIGNMLEWKTSQEIDNQQFTIERSLDGLEYESIGEVEASGTSNEENTYRFLDLDARKGRAYYRVKQIDFDGDYSFSHIVTVDKSTNNNFMISAIENDLNSEIVELTIDAVEEVELTYSIKDMKGDVLEENVKMASVGLNNLSFDLTAYPNGAYRLFLEGDDEVEMITIKKTMSSEESKLPVANKE